MIGETISHYRVTARLGEGGMGEVWLAEDVRLGHKVAIKKLPRRLGSDRRHRQRFEREAKAVASLRHPYIVPLYEYDEIDKELFLVTEYLPGGSLRDVLGEHPSGVPLENVLRWAVQAAEGLSEAHERGILHRDIKPDNLLLTEKGDLRIADFGLSHLESETQLTQTGTVLGTLGYMSPEQVQGQRADARADLFALGATLYELLTGSATFRGDNRAAVLQSILTTEPPPVSTVRGEVSQALDTLLRNLLAKDPAQRPASADEVARTLREIANSYDLAATIPLTVPRRRSRRGRWMTAAALAILVGAVVVAQWLRTRPSSEELGPTPATRIAVIPFTVRGGEDWMSEGVSDLLSAKLNDAGELQTVDPRRLSALMRSHDEGPLAPSTAADVTRRAEAGFFILGNVLQAGDQLHIEASFYDASAPEVPLVRAEAEGPQDDLLGLVNGLTIDLLKERLGDDLRLGILGESIRSSSYPAVKAFLQGEQVWRQQRATDSTPYFEEAVQHDPEFALAWCRLAAVYTWKPSNVISQEHHEQAREALDRANALRDRLSARHQMWLDARIAYSEWDWDRSNQLFGQLVARFPDDVESWDQMGALQFYYNNWRHGRSPWDAEASLQRALDLDPEYPHAQLHMRHLQQAKGDGNLEPFLEDRSVGPYARFILQPERNSEFLEEWSATPDHLLTGTQYFAFLAKSFEAAEQTTELRLDPKRHPEARGLGHTLMATLAAAQGEWGRARSHLDEATTLTPTLVMEQRALLAGHPFLAVPAEEVRAIRDDLVDWNASSAPPLEMDLPELRIHDEIHPQLKLYLLGLLSLRLGEPDRAEQYADELAGMEGKSRDRRLCSDLAHGLHAQVLWQEGRLDEALARFEQAEIKAHYGQYQYSPFYFQSLERYLRAELLLEMGRLEDALRWFGTFNWYPCWEFFYEPHSHLRRGQIHAQLGDTEKAREHYERFLKDWNDCDPLLAPTVANVRAWLEESSPVGTGGR